MGIDIMIGHLGKPGKLNNKYKGKSPDDPHYDGPLQVEIEENMMAPSIGWKLNHYDYFNRQPRIINGKFNQLNMGYGELETMQKKYPSLLMLNKIVDDQGGNAETIPQEFFNAGRTR
jgi:hypothetical protein